MFLFILFLLPQVLNSMQEPASVVVYNAAAAQASSSEDELSDIALFTFMRRNNSDLAKYIKPHLVTVIKEANSSPDSDDSSSDSPSPHRVVKSWVAHPESVKSTPKQELDDIIVKAVCKAFEEKEAALVKKSEKIDGMFSKKDTALITVIFTSIATVITAITGVLITRNNC